MSKKYLPLAAIVFSVAAFADGASSFPNLPTGIKQGGGALLGETVYVGLGSAGANFYALDLQHPTAWQKLPPFPGGERNQPVVSALNGELFVFGGAQKNAQGELHLVNDGYRYSPKEKTWQKLPTRSPLGLVGAASAVHDGKIYFLGGSNLSIYDGIFQDLAAAGDDKAKKDAILAHYFNQRPQDYFFNTTLFSYDPHENRWRNEGALPFSGRAGAAVATKGDALFVINGEIKPGLRTAAAEVGAFQKDGTVKWEKLPDLPPAAKGQTQEGVSGAYVGFNGQDLLLAGGANFIGATKQFQGGNLYAHQGLKKAYQSAIYKLNDQKKWQVVGALPAGAAYGVSITYGNDLLLIGGEGAGGKALDGVQVLHF